MLMTEEEKLEDWMDETVKKGDKVIDSRESHELMEYGKGRGFTVRRLSFRSHEISQSKVERWMQITRGDLDCGDVASHDCVIELKQAGESVGDLEHTLWQLHKCSWTGKFVALIIRNWTASYASSVGKGHVNPASFWAKFHALQCRAHRMRIPVMITDDLYSTFNMIEWIFMHHHEFAKPVNTLNDAQGKFPTPLVMLCGIKGVGEAKATLFLEHAGSFGELARDACEMKRDNFIAKYRQVHGLDKKFPGRVWDAFNEQWSWRDA